MSYHLPKTSVRIFARGIDFCWAAPLAFLFIEKSPLHYFLQGWMPLRIIYFYLITLVISHIFFLKFMGASPGKWICGLRVIPFRPESRNLTWSQAVVRVLSSLMLGFLFGYAPFVTALFRFDRTHLIDWIAETRVVSLTNVRMIPKVYPIWATAIFLVCFLSGLGEAQDRLMRIDFTKSRLLLHSI